MNSERVNQPDAPEDDGNEQNEKYKYSPTAPKPVWSQKYPGRSLAFCYSGVREDSLFICHSRSHPLMSLMPTCCARGVPVPVKQSHWHLCSCSDKSQTSPTRTWAPLG